MTQPGLFIDTNLLVLLVVGSEGRELIAKHRRLDGYSVNDYDILLDLIRQVAQVFVTPNTLTETSNLLAQHGEPERSRILRRLKYIVHQSEEVVVDSTVATGNSQFEHLGLTDAALLEVITSQTPLVTVDFDLYIAALEKGWDTVVNFAQLRDQ